jgi:hypothetical protein
VERGHQIMADDGSQQRKPDFRTALEDAKALATVLVMNLESVLGKRLELRSLAVLAAIGGAATLALALVVVMVLSQMSTSTAGAADATTPAPISGMIVFLPLVSAFLGAIIGAWANSWYRNREAKKARDEEREGLLLFLSIEVASNNRVFKRFLKERVTRPDLDNRASLAATLQSAIWGESKVRLAQLLISGKYLATVALYYERIDILRPDWKVPPGDMSERDTERARNLRTEGINIIQATKKYIRDPAFTPPPLEEDL